MPEQVIAYDIETAPLPYDSLQPRQRRRYRKEYNRKADRDRSQSVTEISHLARSTHPFLGWICAVGMAMIVDGQVKSEVRVARSPDEEPELLDKMWDRFGQAPRQNIRWVTFNGKRFDASFIKARSNIRGVYIPRHDVIDEYPYSQSPHCDVANEWGRQNQWIGLMDVVETLGLDRDPDNIDGTQVAECVKAEDFQSVIDHCREDVRLTIQIFDHLRDNLEK